MFKSVARLVVRGTSEADDKGEDGLIIGCRISKFLKPGFVYELQKNVITGTIVLKEVGKTCVPMSGMYGCWSNTLATVMSAFGKYLYLTDTEMKEQCEKDNEAKSV